MVLKQSKGSVRVAQESGGDISEMSMNNGEDESVQATSESFWEVGKYMRTVNRIENGNKLCSSLRQLITARADIEKEYAKKLNQWSKTWNDKLDRGVEYGTTLNAWKGLLTEADRVAELHSEVGDKLINNVTVCIKQWQKENYHKSMMHHKETKEMEDSFKKVQKPWEKKLNKVLQAKKDFHTSCRVEKSTANQENNARADSSLSTDQLKKLQEKLKKCQSDVESSNEKYTACLNDLNGYNSKYIEDMTEVFEKCQMMEKRRIEFVKKIMFDIHQCLDLSVDSRFPQVYIDLHTTISNTDSDRDIRWWSQNNGADMPMNWPVFEEYAPDLKPISTREKKSQLSHGGDGMITMTSIKQTSDDFVPSGAPVPTNNRIDKDKRDSQTSQQSQSSYQGYNNAGQSSTSTFTPAAPAPAPAPAPQNDFTSRQDSYDESLNPFGDDMTHGEGENNNTNANAKLNTIHNQDPAVHYFDNDETVVECTPPPPAANPFGDGDSDVDEQASQGSGSVPRSGGTDSVMSVPARVMYAYKAEEEDEISAEAGDVITRLSEQDDMGWVKAIAKDGREGLIPASYIEDIE